MKLLRADIQNYRSIKSVTMTFEPPCRILVGINESGKSNVLSALAHLDPDSEVEDDDLRVFGHDENHEAGAYIRFVFALEDADRRELLNRLSAKIAGYTESKALLARDGKGYTLKEYLADVKEGLYSVDVRSKKKYGSYWAASPKWVAKQGLVACANASASHLITIGGGVRFVL